MRKYITYAEYLSQLPDGRKKGAQPHRALPRPSQEVQAQIAYEGEQEEREVIIDVQAEPIAPTAQQDEKRDKRRERRARRRKGFGCFGTAVLALSFCIAVVCAFLVSKGLGLGHLRGEVRRVQFSERSVYCVQIASPSTAEEAATISRDTRIKGGGGYIAMMDGVYLVLASAYASEADCDSVITKLSYSDVTAAKYVLKIPAVTLDVQTEEEQTALLRRGYELLWKTYEQIYALSLTLDSGETLAPQAKLAIGKLSEEYGASIASLDELSERTGSVTVLRIKSELVGLRNVLDGVYLDLNNDATLSSDLKYAYLKVLWSQAALARELG